MKSYLILMRLAQWVKNFFILMRPAQWVKNFFIFLPLFFGLKILEPHSFLAAGEAFVAFSLVASAVYIFNDYHDREVDKKHGDKKNRPLASGAVSVEGALILMFVLWLVGMGGALRLGVEPFYLFGGYVLLNVLYTLGLKHLPILDVVIIAIGFVLRIFVGSYVGGVELSVWIVVMTFLLALFLALAKRLDEVRLFVKEGVRARAVVEGYSLSFLRACLIVMTSVIIVSYLMYAITKADNLYLTSVFVILGMMRYLQIVFVEERGGNPTEIVVKDPFLIVTVLAWLVSCYVIIY